ncbi:hypothetical protein [Rhodocaloribacter sp.]
MRIRNCIRTGLVAVVLVVSAAGPCRSQATNLAHYEAMAVACLSAVPDTARAFRLDAPDAMPYLRAALVARWQSEGRAIFLPDAPAAEALPWLHYEIEEARVAYAKAPDHRLARTVTLALRYTFTGADGRILRDDRCRDVRADTIRSADRARVETAAFPETQAPPPEAGWVRRYLEPAVITAATAVGIYLFFTLRSDRTNNGG